ncbi:MAG: L-rhamnose isomerase [Opitutaceae bacterium]|jgi:L-rhamnose isomerase|nr:L-rhamnose isomerase [Opitutaceae bacterium]
MSAHTSSYALARQRYADLGIDTEAVLARAAATPVSLHCWQGDDVGGFESPDGLTGGGIQATGNYPGKARSIAELRADLGQAMRLIPGSKRLNLHALYADFDAAPRVERSELGIAHFQSWIDWCRAQKTGLDFNPSYFSHPLSNDGFTLASADKAVREFWIAHGIACRRIAAEAGRQLGSRVVTNFWMPDGYKDTPFDRRAPRERMAASLDAIFAEKIDEAHNVDAVECKLFGIGSESYVVGSHEFFLGYATTRQKWLCLDAGHFHPTESVADKISSVLRYVPGLLLHVSRGVRWDSDHVVTFDDPTRAMLEEVVRGDFLPRTAIGLDFFDASINRIAAWVIGTRSAQKALLAALLEPAAQLREAENTGDYTARLAWLEEAKTLPFSGVWDEFCRRAGVPVGPAWLAEVKAYEKDVLSKRT